MIKENVLIWVKGLLSAAISAAAGSGADDDNQRVTYKA